MKAPGFDNSSQIAAQAPGLDFQLYELEQASG
jgi:hypothetical protein